jgi:hypothetical protein
VDVRVRRAILAAVLVNRENALDTASRAPEGLVHRVPQNALGQAPVEAGEALGRSRVDRQDEAEVDGVPKPSASSTRAFRMALSSPRKAR